MNDIDLTHDELAALVRDLRMERNALLIINADLVRELAEMRECRDAVSMAAQVWREQAGARLHARYAAGAKHV